MSKLREVERWIQGKPEMHVFIVFAENNNTNSPHFNYTRKGPDRSQWTYKLGLFTHVTKMNHMNIPIVTWDKEDYGKTMRYYWREKDKPWLTSTLSFGLTTKLELLDTEVVEVTASGEVVFSLGGKWDEAGDSFVEYCNNTGGDGTMYSTGFIKFWVNQENSGNR